MIELSLGNLQELAKLAIGTEHNRLRITPLNGGYLRVEYTAGVMNTVRQRQRVLRLLDSRWVHLD